MLACSRSSPRARLLAHTSHWGETEPWLTTPAPRARGHSVCVAMATHFCVPACVACFGSAAVIGAWCVVCLAHGWVSLAGAVALQVWLPRAVSGRQTTQLQVLIGAELTLSNDTVLAPSCHLLARAASGERSCSPYHIAVQPWLAGWQVCDARVGQRAAAPVNVLPGTAAHVSDQCRACACACPRSVSTYRASSGSWSTANDWVNPVVLFFAAA